MMWAAVVSFAVATGAVIVLRPLTDSVMLIAVLACLPLFTLMRRAFAQQHLVGLIRTSQHLQNSGSSSVNRNTSRDGHGQPRSEFGFARFLYYLGFVFISQLTFRPVLSLTLSDWFFFASFLAACGELLVCRRRVESSIPQPLFWGVVCYSIGGLLSSFAQELPFQSILLIARFVYVTLVWFWLGTVLLQRPEHIQTAVTLWVLSAAMTGAAAVAQLFWGDVVPGTSIVWGRMTGFTQHVNDLGGLTSVALIPALMIATWVARTVQISIVAYASLLFVGSGLVLSGSVGGFFAAAVAMALWFVLSRLRPRLLLMLLLAGMGIFLIVETQRSVGASLPLERITRVIEPNDSKATLWVRVETAEAAWHEIKRNPLVGVGLSPEGTETATGSRVHNALLAAWFEAGLLGALGMLTVFLSVLMVGHKTVVQARSRDEWLIALCLFASVVAFIVFAMGAPVLFQRYGWVSVALLMALRMQQRPYVNLFRACNASLTKAAKC